MPMIRLGNMFLPLPYSSGGGGGRPMPQPYGQAGQGAPMQAGSRFLPGLANRLGGGFPDLDPAAKQEALRQAFLQAGLALIANRQGFGGIAPAIQQGTGVLQDQLRQGQELQYMQSDEERRARRAELDERAFALDEQEAAARGADRKRQMELEEEEKVAQEQLIEELNATLDDVLMALTPENADSAAVRTAARAARVAANAGDTKAFWTILDTIVDREEKPGTEWKLVGDFWTEIDTKTGRPTGQSMPVEEKPGDGEPLLTVEQFARVLGRVQKQGAPKKLDPSGKPTEFYEPQLEITPELLNMYREYRRTGIVPTEEPTAAPSPGDGAMTPRERAALNTIRSGVDEEGATPEEMASVVSETSGVPEQRLLELYYGEGAAAPAPPMVAPPKAQPQSIRDTGLYKTLQRGFNRPAPTSYRGPGRNF